MLSLGLSLLALTILIIGSALWSRQLYTSIEAYRSPLREAKLFPQTPQSQAITSKVVVVMISGLGYEAAQTLNLPVLDQLRQAGATAAIQSAPPTYSQTAWATLISGAAAEINDAPPVDLPLTRLHELEIDTIFGRAHAANLPTSLLGPAEWRRLLPNDQITYPFFVDQPGAESDAAIMEAALPILANSDIKLTWIHFSQVDVAGQSQGAASEAYAQAVTQVDNYLGQISQALDLHQAVLVILADHGHAPDGGHGGDEAEVVRQPLAAIGQGIVPGRYSDVHQTSIAPTLATLLGLAPPTATQGRILFEILRLTERERAMAQLTLAQQHVLLAQAYLAAFTNPPTQVPEAIATNLARAQTNFIANNINGAFQLAQLTQQEMDHYLQTTRTGWIRIEQGLRLAVTGVIILVWLVTLWRRRGLHAGSILIAAIFTVGLYHSLYQLQGHRYSVSALRDFSEWPLDITRRTAVTLLAGGGLMLIFMMMAREGNWLTLLGTGYGFGVLVTFIFTLPLAWSFWQNGFILRWYLPAILSAFWQVTGLLEVMIAAILSLLLPWPLMGLNMFVIWMRRRLDESRARKSDALPGLHL
ncbi:MAG: alkaline phosphatase family protein [Anaerolineae bacterium]